MNDRNTIINVLNEITSDKRMLNHADYWALICGEAAELLKEDERAIKFQSDRLDELLKAQEPVKPIRMYHSQNSWTDHYKCPICDNLLAYYNHYCSSCGRPVKWE